MRTLLLVGVAKIKGTDLLRPYSSPPRKVRTYGHIPVIRGVATSRANRRLSIVYI